MNVLQRQLPNIAPAVEDLQALHRQTGDKSAMSHLPHSLGPSHCCPTPFTDHWYSASCSVCWWTYFLARAILLSNLFPAMKVWTPNRARYFKVWNMFWGEEEGSRGRVEERQGSGEEQMGGETKEENGGDGREGRSHPLFPNINR